MQGYNCIMIYASDKEHLLFCKRIKDPYKGMYNFVGGKIEEGEDGFQAAYRELFEETGISREDIELHHMMDFSYYNQECYVEVYVGYLEKNVALKEETHPLEWLPLTEDFFDINRFAGEGNIGHMVEQVRQYGIGIKQNITDKNQISYSLNEKGCYIGIDGCKGGWIAAIMKDGQWNVEKVSSLKELIEKYSQFDECLLDMAIGLPEDLDDIRPDRFARKIIPEKASSIFPVPCRQAVYAGTDEEAININEKILGKRLSRQSLAIIGKMKEIDVFLEQFPKYKNRICESHPEVCFSKLNGATVLSKKAALEGAKERIEILSSYTNLTWEMILEMKQQLRCNYDDILDACVLAVTANLVSQGYGETIPAHPMKDRRGLIMQMVVPN